MVLAWKRSWFNHESIGKKTGILKNKLVLHLVINLIRILTFAQYDI